MYSGPCFKSATFISELVKSSERFRLAMSHVTRAKRPDGTLNSGLESDERLVNVSGRRFARGTSTVIASLNYQ